MQTKLSKAVFECLKAAFLVVAVCAAKHPITELCSLTENNKEKFKLYLQ